jgi:hypothetical protein
MSSAVRRIKPSRRTGPACRIHAPYRRRRAAGRRRPSLLPRQRPVPVEDRLAERRGLRPGGRQEGQDIDLEDRVLVAIGTGQEFAELDLPGPHATLDLRQRQERGVATAGVPPEACSTSARTARMVRVWTLVSG